MFPNLGSLLLVLAAILVASSTTTAGEQEEEQSTSGPAVPYVSDRDAKGVHCDKAMKDNNEEDFRLFCINQRQSFQQCALSCSEVLHIEPSRGVCKPNRCNFYDMVFPITSAEGHSSQDMHNMARPGKVTLFSFSPL